MSHNTPVAQAAAIIERNWRGIWPADARRMAVDLKRAGVLVPDLPDVAYGLDIDGNGTRAGGISCSLRKANVSLVASSEAGAALVVLDPAECRELAAWLMAAAAAVVARREDCP